MLADVDFVPAVGVHEWLQVHLPELRKKAGDKAVFVLPAFEITGQDQTVPETKQALKAMGPSIHQVCSPCPPCPSGILHCPTRGRHD